MDLNKIFSKRTINVMKNNHENLLVINRLAELRLIPVVSIPESSQAIPLANALVTAGLPCAEITFRTAAAEESIRQIHRQFPQMLVGAGTVLNCTQAEKAISAGANYLVSPGFSAPVVEWCQSHAVPIIPGVATPTEIMRALDYGLNVLKFFPSENLGGIATLKSLHGPFKEIRFIPTGGINLENISGYLQLPYVLAVGGSWFVKDEMIRLADFKKIEELTLKAVQSIKQV
jgi:2-dehydro-3-deoxyphosphogluconate aldolase / (4S)-4-hydroxy-2-oxoglutarate aldolase